MEKVLNSRIFRRKLQYFVRFEGYAGEDEWVDATDCHADDLVAEFHASNPNAVRRLVIGMMEDPEVDRILGQRLSHRAHQYRVRWRGMPPTFDSWVDADDPVFYR